MVGRVRVAGPQLEELKNWLGVTTLDAAFTALLKARLSTPPDITGSGGTLAVTFDHAWVEAYLPGESGLAWRALDPSWKSRDYQPGIPGLLSAMPFDESAYFSPLGLSYSQDFNENDVTGAARSDTTWLGDRFEEKTGNFEIQSQQLKSIASGKNIALLKDVHARNVEVESYVSVPSGSAVGLVARYTGPEPGAANQDPDQNTYMARVLNSGGEGKVMVLRNNGGTWTPLTSDRELPGNATSGTLRFEVSGAKLRVLFNGVVVIDWFTDSNPLMTAGQVGFRANNISATPSTMDNLQVSWTDTRDQLPHEFYEDQIETYLQQNYPGVSLADVPYDGPIIAKYFKQVPDGYGYQVVGATTTHDDLPDLQKHRVRINLKNSAGTKLFGTDGVWLNVPDVSLKRITIAYVVSGTNRTPQLLVDGAVVATGSAVADGSNVTIVLDHFDSGTSQTSNSDKHLTFERKAGQYHAIGLDAMQFSEESLRRLRAELNQENLALAVLPAANRPSDPGEKVIGRTLALAMMSYFADVNRYTDLAKGLTGARTARSSVGSGIGSSEATVKYRDDLQLFTVPKEFGVDIPNNLFGAYPIDADTQENFNDRFRLDGYIKSALEHAVVEELLNIESVSTVKGLQWAEDNGVRVYEFEKTGSGVIDRQTGQPIVDVSEALLLSSSTVENDIETAVLSGARVTVPQINVHMDEWDGAVYIAETRSGGQITSIAYMIDETNGGFATNFNPVLPKVVEPGKQAWQAVTYAGDPVNVANGNMFRDEVDFALPNIGLPITFARHYDAQETNGFGLGIGWTFTFSDRLQFKGPGGDASHVVWVTGEGRRHTFFRDSAGVYDTPATFHGGTFSYNSTTAVYSATDKHGLVHRFDSAGRLIEISDRHGNKLGMTYNGSGYQLHQISDTTSGTPVVKLTFDYSVPNRTTITDFTNRTWEYVYRTLADGKNYLVRVVRPSDAQTPASEVRYTYYNDNGVGPRQGMMSEIIEPNGGRHTYTYYTNQKSFEVTDAEGYSTHMTYDWFQNVTTFTNERGESTLYKHDTRGLLQRQIEADRVRTNRVWDVDRQLLLQERDAFGRAEYYQYDGNGNLTRIIERDGLATAFTYAPAYNLIASIAKAAGTGAEQLTQYRYGVFGKNLKEIEDPLGNITRMTYYANGLVETRTAPKGTVASPDGDYTTTYFYNTAGQVLREMLPDLDGVGVGDPAPEITSTYDTRGNLLTRSDPTGLTTAWTYDLLGRRLSQELPDPDGAGPEELITTFAYDPIGDLVQVTDPRGNTTSYVYDLRQDLVEIRNPDGSHVRHDYDGARNRIATRDALGRTTRVAYDERNRPVHVHAADGALMRTQYNGAGQVARVIDANENATALEHDFTFFVDPGLNQEVRVETVTDALGQAARQYFNRQGHLVKSVDRRGQETLYTYDKLNRVTQVRRPQKDSGGTLIGYHEIRTIDYDAHGNVTKETRYDLTGLTPAQIPADPRSLDASRHRTYETRYDVHDRPVEWVNPAAAQNTRSATYDNAGRVTSRTDELGRTTDLAYDAAGRLLSETRPDPDEPGSGQPRPVTAFVYDANGNVSSVTERISATENRTTTYSYDALNRSVRTLDAEGFVHESLFDAAGQLAATIDPLERSTLFAYDERGRVVKQTLADPDREGSQAAPVTRTTYDAVGNVLSVTDALGRVTTFEYDSLNRRTLSTPPVVQSVASTQTIDNGQSGFTSTGTWASLSINGQGIGHGGTSLGSNDGTGDTATWTFSGLAPGWYRVYGTWPVASNAATDAPFTVFDGSTELGTTRVDQTRSPDDFTDGSGWAWEQLGTLVYLTSGTLKVTLTDEATGSRYTVADAVRLERLEPSILSRYDAEGNLVSQTDQLGRTTAWEYDGLGRMVHETLPDPDGSGTGNPAPETFWAYNSLGELSSVADHLGRTTEYQYDVLSRRTKEILPDPDQPGTGHDRPETVWTYDAVGNVRTVTDALDRITTWDYDNLNRRVQETLPDPAMGVSGPVTKWAYDLVGNLISTTDALNQVTTRVYDKLGRLVETTLPDPDGAGSQLAPRTTFVYDAVGSLLSEKEWLNATTALTTTYTYDRLNRQVTVTDPRSETTVSEYDLVGNLTKLTDAEGNETAFEHDELNRLVRETNELNEARTLVYDVVGNVTQIADRNGRVREFDYDRLDRMVEERWKDSLGATVDTITTVYNDAGLLASQSDSESSAAYAYDRLDRVLTVSNSGTPGVPAVVFTFGYDAVGNVLSRSETIGGAAAGTNTYVYDALDRVVRIEQSGAGVTDKRVDLAYNALGQYTAIARYADLAGTQFVGTSSYGYDFTHRLTSLTHDLAVSPDVAYTWQYDAASRIVGMTSSDGGNTLSYDAAGQLTGATLTSESYTYDGTGNRTNSGYVTDANNRLASDGTYSYLYDDEGNRTRKTTTATGDYVDYSWDHRNRLARVEFRTSGGALSKATEYDYDTSDRRIAKRVDENGDGSFERTERFVYDGFDVALAFDDAGSLTNRYLHGPDVDQLFADEDAVDGLLWALADHQQTVRDLADSTGTVVNHIEYDSFGEITGQSNAALTPHFAYTGQEWDADAELYYYDARWYDPGVGRFVSEDPSGLGPDPNLYRYVENSPWNYTDPTGRVLSSAIDSVAKALPQAFNALGKGLSGLASDIGNIGSFVASAFSGPPVPTRAQFSAAIGATGLTAEEKAGWMNTFSNASPDAKVRIYERWATPLALPNGAASGAIPAIGGADNLRKDGSVRVVDENIDPITARQIMAGDYPAIFLHPTHPSNSGESTFDGAAFWKNALGFALVGDYSGAKPDAAGLGLSVGLSFTGLDLPKDIADLAHGIHHWEWSWGHAGKMALNTVALLPVVGMAKLGKYVDEGAEISRVGGRFPINSRYAGQTYPVEKLPTGIQAKYPNSVYFDQKGFADFSPYAEATVKLKGLTGDYATDAAKANKAVKLKTTPDGYVWHHVKDGKTMLLVPKDLHQAVRHTGGSAVIRHSGM